MLPCAPRRVELCRCALLLPAAFALLIGSAIASDSRSQSEQLLPPFEVGQVLAVSTGQPVAFEQWLAGLASADVIYLGEEHHNPAHVRAAITVLEAILVRKNRAVLLMEMFGWDGQAALHRYKEDPRYSRDAFLADVGWDKNWGGAFEDYEPLVAFARQKSQVITIALNPPRFLVRKVAKEGLVTALEDPEMARWGVRDQPFVDDQSYRDLIIGQLRRCHGGLDEEGYQRMYEASLFRDEGMAKTVDDWLYQIGPLVSYTGGGHIQYGLPVPNRVLRRRATIGDPRIKQVTVYLHSFDPARQGEVQELLKEGIADYLWLTSLSAHGAPRRCR